MIKKLNIQEKKHKLYCDSCLEFIEKTYAIVFETDPEDYKYHFCSKKCFFNGISEMIYENMMQFNEKKHHSQINHLWERIDLFIKLALSHEKVKEIFSKQSISEK